MQGKDIISHLPNVTLCTIYSVYTVYIYIMYIIYYIVHSTFIYYEIYTF